MSKFKVGDRVKYLKSGKEYRAEVIDVIDGERWEHPAIFYTIEYLPADRSRYPISRVVPKRDLKPDLIQQMIWDKSRGRSE